MPCDKCFTYEAPRCYTNNAADRPDKFYGIIFLLVKNLLMGSGGGFVDYAFPVKPYRGGVPGFLCCLWEFIFYSFAGAKAA